MKWFGHLIRLHNETPARQALRVGLQKSKRPRGKQKLTWIEQMKKQLETNNLTWEEACEVAKDRTRWRNICNNLK